MILDPIYKGIPFVIFDRKKILGPIFQGIPFIKPDQNNF